jgi:hypothetical protein
VRGLKARDHLDAARAGIGPLRSALASGDPSVPARLAGVQREARAARRLTSDPVWRAASHVPYLGRTLRTGAGIARAADDLARAALPDAALAARTLSPSRLRASRDTIALAPFATALPALERVRDSVAQTQARVTALPSSFVLPAARDARADLLHELDALRREAVTAAAAARVTPAMLGRDGPRRYFLAILNNAEMRGSGGLLGAYGILEADRGRLRILRLGTNGELSNTTPTPAVDLGPEFTSRYRRWATDSFWVNGNMSPHFPYASTIWTSLWARTHGGQRLDGTIAVDPVALSRILAATGPATLPSGEVIDADNVVPLTESEAYERFAKDNGARDAYLQQVARAAYERLLGATDTAALLHALGSSAGDRHLQLASEHPDEEAAFADLPVAGTLPAGGAAPYLEVVTQNAGGNKLDYWLRRSVTRTRGADGVVTVTVALTNDAPRGLPTYVQGRLDLPPGTKHVDGAQYEYVSVYCSATCGLDGATLDGRPLAMESETERGHAVLSTYLELLPGRTTSLVLRLVGEPPGAPGGRPQPLVVR